MKILNSYKKKFCFLVSGSLIFLIISFNLAFKRTISEIKSYGASKMQLVSLHDAPMQLQLLEKRLLGINENLKMTSKNERNQEIYLLERANLLIKGSNLRITELPKNNVNTKDGFLIKTQQLVIQGSFNELLRILYSFEKDQTIGNVCSVDFYSQQDLKSGRNILKMRIYVQNYIQVDQQ